jgi:predicted nucleic acid-binding protein
MTTSGDIRTLGNIGIIADTSIWIEFLKNNPDIFNVMQKLLEQRLIIGVEFIFGELLQGVKSKRERDIIYNYWDCLPRLNESGTWLEAGDYSNQNRLYEKGIGLIDCAILVLAIKNNLKIWTLDKKLRSVIKDNLKYV